jgi:BASS family bile acid:Na+ symporter
MVAIILIIGAVIAMNHANLTLLAIPLLAAIFWHNLLGLGSGYFLAKLFKFDDQTCRTIAIEVGMQNSGLAVALAQGYFSTLAALPGAIFSIWHNITGSILAGYWGRKVLAEPADSFEGH